jgi:hypothetical protein
MYQHGHSPTDKSARSGVTAVAELAKASGFIRVSEFLPGITSAPSKAR